MDESKNMKVKTLEENELESVSGGTKNRWCPERCGKVTRVTPECNAKWLFFDNWCDHYKRKRISISGPPGHDSNDVFRHTCAMGRFDYEGKITGE